MKPEARARRTNEILDAAVALLDERGYRDTDMLSVARRSSASKETLYSWFGDKRGLFQAAIERNARNVQEILNDSLEADAPPKPTLIAFGRAMLALLLGDSAVAINRAAISECRSDPSLAETLAARGREATLPGLVRYLERQNDLGRLHVGDAAQAGEDALGLLLGDVQIRRLLGVFPAPGQAWIDARAERATERFLRLYG